MSTTGGMPPDAFTIKGGCNCSAIRYIISIPEFSQRFENPYKTPGANINGLRIPMTVIDHCNDCRAATAAVLPMAIVTDARTVRVRVAKHSPVANVEGRLDVDEVKDEYAPAVDVFDFQNPRLSELCLSFYKSSPKRTRWFCGRCGTPIGYTIDPGVVPEEWGWPPMLDLWLGTVDREYLQEQWMAPERMLWCEKGIGWVRELAREGHAVPEHPLTSRSELGGFEEQVLTRCRDRHRDWRRGFQ